MTTDTGGGICPACRASPRGYCDPCGRRADVTGPTEEEREMERLKARIANLEDDLANYRDSESEMEEERDAARAALETVRERCVATVLDAGTGLLTPPALKRIAEDLRRLDLSDLGGKEGVITSAPPAIGSPGSMPRKDSASSRSQRDHLAAGHRLGGKEGQR